MMTLADIDRTRVEFFRTRGSMAAAGYNNGWLEFFESGRFIGSIKTRPGLFIGWTINFFNKLEVTMNMLNDLDYRMTETDLNRFDDDCQSEYDDDSEETSWVSDWISDWTL